MFIRHNIDTGSLAIYANRAEATDNGHPVYASEEELAAGKASISELARFYNQLTGEAVKTFRDKAAAARRVWSAGNVKLGIPSEGAAIVAEVEKEMAEQKAPEAPAPVATEKSKRGRKPGTGEFAGKTIFAKKQVNPRRPGTAGFKSFEIIRDKPAGVPYADYIAAGGRPNDLRWDLEHKYAEVK